MEPVTRMAEFADRRQPESPAVEFFFDLASPFSYLAAERVERLFGTVTWTPAALPPAGTSPTCLRSQAEARAKELRLPLVWPERWPAPVPTAMRAAGRAGAEGRSAAFALAALRLAFCGGYDLEEPAVLAEALAAAAMEGEVAVDERADAAVAVVSRRLLAAGVIRLPTVRVHDVLYWGEERLEQAAAAARATGAAGRAAAAE